MFLLSLLCISLVSAQVQWVVQNIYRNPNGQCAPQDLLSINSWRIGSCVKWNSTAWNMKTCNNNAVQTTFFSDSTCKTVLSQSSFQANACGTASTPSGLQGVFFACPTQASPPVLSNQNNDVYTDVIYLSDGISAKCDSSQVYQSLSYVSNACVLSENRTCQCSGGTCSSALYASPCTAAANPITLNGCAFKVIGGISFDATALCTQAVSPTPTPADPQNPPGTNPSTIAACSAATTLQQCVGGALVSTPNGPMPTLPITGLIKKCCAWCGAPDGTGVCQEPPFSTQGVCTCPSNTTAFATQVSILACPSGKQSTVGCSCTGRPVGAPQCNTNSGSGLTNSAFQMGKWALLFAAAIAILCHMY